MPWQSEKVPITPSLSWDRWKVKVKLSLCLTKHHAIRTYWGSGGIAPRILDLGTRWRWVVSFTPQSLYPQGKSTWYPLDRRMGGPQSHSGRGGEEVNSQPLPGLELPIIQPVAQRYTAELSRLLTKIISELICWIFVIFMQHIFNHFLFFKRHIKNNFHVIVYVTWA
jgi:hypothetical protein